MVRSVHDLPYYYGSKMNRHGEGLRLLSDKQAQDELRWEQLSAQDKFADWADRHQYTIILGGWASSLALAGAIISRDK